MRRVILLPREQQLGIWKRVVALYARENRTLPAVLSSLCHEPFVDQLLQDEVFWGLAGEQVNRQFYAHATEHLPAVYATAALLAAYADALPLSLDDRLLLSGDNRG